MKKVLISARATPRVFLGRLARSTVTAAIAVTAVIAAAPAAKGDSTDVALLFVTKAGFLQQTAPSNPVFAPNPFTIKLGANASRTSSIVSGQVVVPGGAVKNMPNDGKGNLFFDGGSFPSQAAMDAVYPDGSYTFNLQTVTPPTAYNNTVSLTGSNYPNLPHINSGTWATGGLQVDATQGYTVNWDTFNPSPSNDRITFRIANSSGGTVFTQTLAASVTSSSVPANTLVPGAYYTAYLTFERRQLISGTPTRLGTYVYETSFTIATISGIPALSGPSTALATVGQLFVYQCVATNHPFSYDAQNLPPGLNFDAATGIISGFPTATGTPQVQLRAQNINGISPVKTLSPTIRSVPSSGPMIISTTSALAYSGVPFSFQVVTKNATPAARVSATGLPAGLTIDPVTGIISGTTSAVGSFAVNLTVTDGNFVVTGSLQLTFTADPGYPVITNADKVIVPRNAFFSYTIATPGAVDPADPPVFTFVGTLPPGLTFNAATRTISGTYSGPLESETELGNIGDAPNLSGGAILGGIQLFGTNSHGTSTFQLFFLAPPSGAVNISTRLFVGSGDNVLIAGFIITGTAPKVLIVRGLGPSTGLPGALQDPVLELHDTKGNVVINDNWRDTQEQIIKDTTIPPPDNRESAIVIGLDPGSYTAILSGKGGSQGIALVEVFDLGTASLDPATKVQLAQISTRGNVLTGDNVMIGGFIVSGVTTKVIVRAIGPSLASPPFNITTALKDTILELHDSNGATFINDDWRSDQEQEIINTTVAPTDDRESAIVRSLVPGAYTAIVRGKGNSSGVALVEVYSLQ